MQQSIIKIKLTLNQVIFYVHCLIGCEQVLIPDIRWVSS